MNNEEEFMNFMDEKLRELEQIEPSSEIQKFIYGLRRGLQIGKHKECIRVAKELLKEGVEQHIIQRATDLSASEIRDFLYNK